VASVSSCENLPLCLIKPVLVGSKMDPLLAKAKPISGNGNTSVITYIRKERKKKNTCGEIEVRGRSETQ